MGAVISAQRDTMSKLAQDLRQEVDARGNDGLAHVRLLIESVAGTSNIGEVADEHVVSLVNAFESNLLAIHKKAVPPIAAAEEEEIGMGELLRTCQNYLYAAGVGDNQNARKNVGDILQVASGFRKVADVPANLRNVAQSAVQKAINDLLKTKTDFQGVREFNVAAGNTADTFNPSQISFYTGMQCEELAEKMQAIAGDAVATEGQELFDRGMILSYVKALQDVGAMFKSRPASFIAMIARANRMDLLDADLDVVVVSHGSVLSQGVDGDASMGEVQRANLSKIVDGKVLKDANGKILKPEGWTPPNLLPFIKKD